MLQPLGINELINAEQQVAELCNVGFRLNVVLLLFRSYLLMFTWIL